MSYKSKGVYLGASEIKKVGAKQYSVREIYLNTDTDTEYPQHVKFQLFGDAKCGLIEGLKKGQEVEVHWNLKGNVSEKDGRRSVFNNLDAWKIEKVGEAVETVTATPVAGTGVDVTVGDDDLPF